MPYTSDDLVTEVRRRSRLPSATDISDGEILQYADQEMQTTIADVLRNADASFWVATHTTSIVSGTATYDIPRRAIGAGLERVEIEDSSGNREPVAALSEDDSWRFANGGRSIHWPGRFAFTLEGEALRLWPEPSSDASGLTLRVRYQRQPARIVSTSACAAVDTATSTTAISASAAVPSTFIADVLVDIIRGDGVHDVTFADRLLDGGYPGSAITLDASTPIVVADVKGAADIGATRVDYVALAGTTPYPQIPVTLWPLLVSKTVVGVLEALGDRQGMAAAQATAAQREAAARSIVTPRSREVPRLISRNSYLRRGAR